MNKIALLLLAIGLLSVPAFAEEAAGADANWTAAAGAGGNATTATLDDSAGAAGVAVNESEVGALPGDWNYGFKRFFENFDEFFTFDKSESAKKHARYGLMRAMESHVLSGKAHKLAAEGRGAEANATLTEVEKLAKEQTDELDDAEADLESAIEDGSANETEVEQVQNYTRKSIIVLQRVYEKAPEAAKDGLLRALNNSISNYERHIEKVEEKAMGREERKAGSGDENETKAGNGSFGKNKTKTDDEDASGNETETEDGLESGTGGQASVGTNVSVGKGIGGHGKDAGQDDGEGD
jgi:hypothetical protein